MSRSDRAGDKCKGSNPLLKRNDSGRCSESLTYDYLKLLIRITSLVTAPRAQASCLPSLDHPKENIRSDIKLVSRFGGPPSSGWLHMLETPCRVSIYRREPSSLAQQGATDVLVVGGISRVLTSCPPSKGKITRVMRAKLTSVLAFQQAISFPSGEITGPIKKAFPISLTGSPPSMGTFRICDPPWANTVYTTHLPSGEQLGQNSLLPLVNCLGLPPSMFTLQI